jgi:hypothetical protein
MSVPFEFELEFEFEFLLLKDPCNSESPSLAESFLEDVMAACLLLDASSALIQQSRVL